MKTYVITCLNCLSTFNCIKKKQKYCCRECALKQRAILYSGKGNPNFGKVMTKKSRLLISTKAKDRIKKFGHPSLGKRRPDLIERNRSDKLRSINSKRQKGKNNTAKNPLVGKKISIEKKAFYRIHPEKHANRIMAKKGFISKPQSIMFELLRQVYPVLSIDCIEYPIKTNSSTRFADVALISEKIDFEFDGEYWHNSSEDNIRDNELNEVSWKTIRFSKISDIKDYIKKYGGQGTIIQLAK